MIANPKEFCSGAFFVAFGVGTYLINRSYYFGDPSDIGPGFFPTILAIILIGIGLVVAVKSFAIAYEPLPAVNWRATIATIAALLVFGFALRPLGLVPAVVLLCMISQAGSTNARWLSSALISLSLAAASTLIFIYGLGVPLQPFGTLFR